MAQKKAITYAEHLELAARIKETGKLLQDIQLRVGNGLGTSSKPSNIANQIVRKFQDLKHELDEILFRDFGEGYSEDELKRLYYGPTKYSKVVLHRSRAKPDE